MGCGNSTDAEEKNNRTTTGNDPENLPVKKDFLRTKTTCENLNTLGNKEIVKYNESAMRVTKYWKDQKPPDDQETPWVDELFSPNQNSLFSLDSNGNPTDPIEGRPHSLEVDEEEVVWKRADEIFPIKHCVFQEKIEFDDIIQGSISNCYFLSAISAMTEWPELIVSLFRTLKVTKNGCYEIVVRINGVWQVVLVDNYFPCSINTKKPIFCKPNGFEIWVMLLEKAWAKVNGGYRNTVLGLRNMGNVT